MVDTDVTPRTYPNGVPCWVNVETDDVDASAAFYAGLFGWTYEDAGGARPLLFARLEGLDVAAIAGGDPRAGWLSFIACDDIDEACARVERSGGRVEEVPSPRPFGSSATCVDPQGATFLLWQAATHPGAQLVNSPGSWNFSDLHTPDPDAALDFYGQVFGWRSDPELGAGMIRLPGYGDHLAATTDPDIHERQAFAPEGFADVVAGLTRDPHASWAIRFAVADRDQSAATAEALGARIESRADTEWTRDAVVIDPRGARFILSEFAPAEA